MNLRISSVSLGALLAWCGAVHAQDVTCGPAGGSFTVAGSSTVYPVARAWADAYTVACPSVNITVVDGLGSSDGASRLCSSASDAVDIGTLSRTWNADEATLESTSVDYIYRCVSEPTRSAIQVDVAIDGLTVAMQENGAGAGCVAAIGGLTLGQLRWIYSSYTVAQLEAGGDWSAVTSLPGNDNDDSTHLWSDLSTDAACPDVEIRIAGADEDSGTFEYFTDLVLLDFDAGESIATDRPDGYSNSVNDADTVALLIVDEAAMGYFGYAYYSSSTASLYPAPIQNTAATSFVAPNPTSIADGRYEPFARRIYMNVLQDTTSQANTAPFIAYGFSDAGVALVTGTGYSAIPEAERTELVSRVQGDATAPAPTTPASAPVTSTFDQCGPSGASFSIAGSSSVLPVAQAWATAYQEICSVAITVEGGGSSAGALRVCGDTSLGASVEIGDMSRNWEDDEAVVDSSGYQYTCRIGDTTRVVVQVEVAIDGLSFTLQAGGTGAACVAVMGGLTLDQLRWIYSSYTVAQLEAGGDWSAATSLPGNDSDESTHLWSELSTDAACPDVEIKIAGPDVGSGTFDYFQEVVFLDSDEGESMASARSYFNSSDDTDIVSHVLGDPSVIAFFGYAYYSQNSGSLYLAPIQNSAGTFVRPSPETVAEGTYEPFSRRLYMNLLTTAMIQRHLFYLGCRMRAQAL